MYHKDSYFTLMIPGVCTCVAITGSGKYFHILVTRLLFLLSNNSNRSIHLKF